MSALCFTPDDWLRERMDEGQAVWVARLRDGRLVFQDDGRPGAEPFSAWLRLRASGLAVVNMGLCFRSRLLLDLLPTAAPAYYFVKQSTRFVTDCNTMHYYLLGFLQGDTVRVQQWKVPELILMTESFRVVPSDSPCLIRSSHDMELPPARPKLPG